MLVETVSSILHEKGIWEYRIGKTPMTYGRCHYSRNKGQNKLDVISIEVLVKTLINNGRTCLLIFEDNEYDIIMSPSQCGKCNVVFDPLDGSSNIYCGVFI